MNNQDSSKLIEVYKGEGRYLIIPLILHIGGYWIQSLSYMNLREDAGAEELGRALVECIRFIEREPLSRITPKESEMFAVWKQNSLYKSELSFWRNNQFARVVLSKQGGYSVSSFERSITRKGEYGDCIITKKIDQSCELTEIGRALIDVFEAADEYYNNIHVKRVFTDIILLDGSRLTITPPKNSHFEDTGDMGAMECYQSYSYIAKEGDEASAIFYLTLAPEIDCDLGTDNVRACWEETYGAADMFEMKEESKGIYTHQAIMKNKEQYRKSYFLQMEEDLILECGMTVYMPNRRKKLCEKMETLFEEFAAGCRFTS